MGAGGRIVAGTDDLHRVVSSLKEEREVALQIVRDERLIEIMIIPHTLAVTTLGALSPGRRVNLEMDMVGKYVQRYLQLHAREGSP